MYRRGGQSRGRSQDRRDCASSASAFHMTAARSSTRTARSTRSRVA
jgi:hypothetical protein